MGIVAELKHGAEGMWESAADGWHRLSAQTVGALTRFRPSQQTDSGSAGRSDIGSNSVGWALLAGDIFEDNDKFVVRLEVPGMEKSDLDIEAHDDILQIKGEKRLESESPEGCYRILQCAYGSFNRTIRLPGPVVSDNAKASYSNGVLRVELPKAKAAGMKQTHITVG